MQFQTLAVHSGHPPAVDGNPSAPPLERAASWSYDRMEELEAVFAGERRGYMYARNEAPTAALLEQALTALEGGQHTLVFSSGMAAIASVLLTFGSGRRVLATSDLYGLSYRLLQQMLPQMRAEVRFAGGRDLTALGAMLAAWEPHLLVVETLSNPLLKVADVGELVRRAHAAGCLVLVDNTFASPYLYRPAQHGADFTVESLTKYINGHGDVTGGAVTTLDPEHHAALKQHRTLVGPVLDSEAAWLTLRGVRTLALRMQQHCRNAAQLAAFLASHPAVARVNYPGLPEHPDHQLATAMFGSVYGGMLSFEVMPPTRERAWTVMERLELAWRCPTLGDITTLVSYPAHASHRGLTPEQRAAIGIGDGLIRVSVGIEAAEDIIADFAQALR
ncbi:MAG: PLP-dependent transferase [Chloroflexi bacterium]|nr:MAG: PLP-dependent transferase [Chloroflexota bacterium]